MGFQNIKTLSWGYPPPVSQSGSAVKSDIPEAFFRSRAIDDRMLVHKVELVRVLELSARNVQACDELF